VQANPIWPVEERRPKLDSDLRTDALVIGGGMAGISCASNLRKAGYDVALIERDEIGGPATGASSGVLYYGSGTNFDQAVGLFGAERAKDLWKETSEVIEEILATSRKVGIECGVRECGSIMVARDESQVQELEREYKGVKGLGLPVRLLGAGEVREFYPLTAFSGGLAFDGVGQVHPGILASGVADVDGVKVFEGTPSVGWKEENGGATVRTPGGTVRCSKVIFATNNEPLFGFESHFEIESSVILASKPTPRVREAFPQEKILWTMDERYDIVYPRGDRLILELYELGDEESKLSYYYPGLEFELDQQWGEVWAKPKDWMPIAGMVSTNVAVSIGMGDQGIIMSWLVGKKMPQLLEGKKDWFGELASPQRFGEVTLS
jgi:glycine/D-amino acid oxidase-like deaminating enzyme